MNLQIKLISFETVQTINSLINVDQSLLLDNVKFSEIGNRLNKKISLLKDNIAVGLPIQFSRPDQNEFLNFCSRISYLNSKLDSINKREKQIRNLVENFKSTIQGELKDNNKNELLRKHIAKSMSLKRQNDYFTILIILENYKIEIFEKLQKFYSIKCKQLSLENSINHSAISDFDSNYSSQQSEILKSLIINYEKLQKIVRFSTETKFKNLKYFIVDLVGFIQAFLRENLTRELEEILDKFNYPKIINDSNQNEKSKNFKKNIHNHIYYLLIIDVPFFEERQSGQNQNSVIETIIKPFEKRFRFHFFTNRKTNDINKPEWYLSQIMQWIKEQYDFFCQFIQPIFDEINYWSKKSALVLFINKLMCLIKDKLETDIKMLLENSEQFLHTIDELLNFNNQLISFLKSNENAAFNTDYQNFYTSLHIICENQLIFNHWLNLEKQIWQKYLDEMFSNDSLSLFLNLNLENQLSQNFQVSNEGLLKNETFMSTKCAEYFILLIKSIQDRYYNLPFASKKLSFANLQIDLLKEFHLRLCQILRDEANNIFSKTYLGVLNTIHYVIKVLDEWKNSKFYIQLQFYKLKFAQFVENHKSLKNLNTDSSFDDERQTSNFFEESIKTSKPFLDIEGTIFDDLLPSYEKVKIDIINQIVHKCKWEFTSRAYSYIHEKWMCMPIGSEIYKLTLTESASDMLISLRNMLHLLKDSVTQDIFLSIIKKLSRELDNFYYKDLILNNTFNEGGINQLNYDIKKYLMPILNEFTINCDINCFFKLTNESINLMMLKKGPALLLKDLIQKALLIETNPSKRLISDYDSKLNLYNAKNALKELNVYFLSCEQSRKILDLRSDLN